MIYYFSQNVGGVETILLREVELFRYRFVEQLYFGQSFGRSRLETSIFSTNSRLVHLSRALQTSHLGRGQ